MRKLSWALLSLALVVIVAGALGAPVDYSIGLGVGALGLIAFGCSLDVPSGSRSAR